MGNIKYEKYVIDKINSSQVERQGDRMSESESG